jgi:uncharacterized protein YndB with AHSA1/START domain
MSEQRRIEFEVEVPGTPEEVWEAIATGPGVSAWFVPTEIEEREGGDVTFHLAPGQDGPATVSGWEPPRRFAYAEEVEGEPLATEFLVEARAGGTCVVRLVSTFAADWDDEDLKGMEAGWTGYLDNLRVYLTHFRGRPADTTVATADSPDDPEATWRRLRAAIDVDGVVEREATGDLLLRTDDGLVNFVVYPWDGRTVATVRRMRFDGVADAGEWEAWLARAL